MFVLLDVDPVLAGFGQVAAIIICLFVLIFILVAIAFNLAMAFGMAWLREKADLIKVLRPTVDSVNKTSEAALQGQPPVQSSNAVMRTISQVPSGIQAADKKVDEVTGKVASTVIEVHARTIQAQMIVKAFLFPVKKSRQDKPPTEDDKLYSSGYHEATKEKTPGSTTALAGSKGYEQAVEVS